jgi:hypothetical protein
VTVAMATSLPLETQDFCGLSSFCLRNSVIYLYVVQVLIIGEKLAELYESEQQWSKAAQMLSGIDLDFGMRSESKILRRCFYFYFLFFCLFKEVIVMNILLFCNYFSIWMILLVEFFSDLNTVLPLFVLPNIPILMDQLIGF